MRTVAFFIALFMIGCMSAETKPEPVKNVTRITTFSTTKPAYVSWCDSYKMQDCDTGYDVQEYSVKNEGIPKGTHSETSIDGRQYQLKLPFGKQYLLSNDRQNIWVAPGSKIKISPSRPSNKPVDTLVVEYGEVFVEAKKPFASITVISGATKTSVKGNSLVNIKNNLDADSTIISIARGVAAIAPGDGITFELKDQLETSIDKATHKFNVRTCDSFEVTKKWTLGFVRTNTLKEYFDQISRYYNKTIVYKLFDPQNEKWDLSMNYLTDTLENNLAVVGRYTGIDVEELGDTITVTKRRK